MAYNRTSTTVTDHNAALLGDNRVLLIEDGANSRWVMTAQHDMGQLDYLLRVSYYGKYFDNEAGGIFDDAMLVIRNGIRRLRQLVVPSAYVTRPMKRLQHQFLRNDGPNGSGSALQPIYPFRV